MGSTLGLGALFGGNIGSLFGAAKGAKKIGENLVPDIPALPQPQDNTVLMPDPDPLEQIRARERSMIEQVSRSGRRSTILTNRGGTQKLGS